PRTSFSSSTPSYRVSVHVPFTTSQGAWAWSCLAPPHHLDELVSASHQDGPVALDAQQLCACEQVITVVGGAAQRHLQPGQGRQQRTRALTAPELVLCALGH